MKESPCAFLVSPSRFPQPTPERLQNKTISITWRSFVGLFSQQSPECEQINFSSRTLKRSESNDVEADVMTINGWNVCYVLSNLSITSCLPANWGTLFSFHEKQQVENELWIIWWLFSHSRTRHTFEARRCEWFTESNKNEEIELSF